MMALSGSSILCCTHSVAFAHPVSRCQSRRHFHVEIEQKKGIKKIKQTPAKNRLRCTQQLNRFREKARVTYLSRPAHMNFTYHQSTYDSNYKPTRFCKTLSPNLTAKELHDAPKAPAITNLKGWSYDNDCGLTTDPSTLQKIQPPTAITTTGRPPGHILRPGPCFKTPATKFPSPNFIASK